MGYWDYYPPYVCVAEKKAKAARKLEQLRKKNPDIQPIRLEGRSIARTWWGKSWNLNLERYADYSNRIGRGRSYVRNGAVLDLRIDAGEVQSLVQGSQSKPYSIKIGIKPVGRKIWQEVKAACEGQLESLQELLAGKFPRTLSDIFMAQGSGLFPAPGEIEFHCSCPDWASMCKHVAATLYGIGSRLDDDPALFFRLRKVRMEDLISQTLEDTTYKLLEKAEKKTGRVIAESDLAGMFGIEMEDHITFNSKWAKSPATPPSGKRISPPASGKVKAAPATGKPGKKSAPEKIPSKNKRADKKTTLQKAPPKTKSKSPYDTVVGIILRSRKGVTVAGIREKTGFDDIRIRNFIRKARKEGKIRNIERGVYISSSR